LIVFLYSYYTLMIIIVGIGTAWKLSCQYVKFFMFLKIHCETVSVEVLNELGVNIGKKWFLTKKQNSVGPPFANFINYIFFFLTLFRLRFFEFIFNLIVFMALFHLKYIFFFFGILIIFFPWFGVKLSETSCSRKYKVFLR
jgi:hypothetical protein